MAQTAFSGTPIQTAGDLPHVGTKAPAFELAGQDLGPVTLDGLPAGTVVLNIFPSVDTDTCAMSVRQFNKLASGLDDTTVVCVSKDLPFALSRFCGAEGLDDVVTASAFRSSFGEDYGVTMTDGPLAGLLARAVIVVGPDGNITYTQLVPEISDEPDYEAVLAALA